LEIAQRGKSRGCFGNNKRGIKGGKGMKKYKVLRVVNGELISPYQDYNYGKVEDVLGKKMVCEDFDDNENEDCSIRFYATDIKGLIYSLNIHKDNRVFEVKMGGRSVINSEYKQGFEEQTIIRMLPKSEVRKLIKEQSKAMDWDYYHACYPVNPLKIDKPFDKEKALKLLKEWDSVWASVWASVLASVRASVSDSVGDFVWVSVWASVSDSVRASVSVSVRASVLYSVGDSVWAYISSLFPNIKKWKYIEHKEGVNPFQSSIDLWHMGLVPSFDGEVWRLHKGKKAEVVLEITGKELRGVKE
jgi:hypothetical protein